MGHLAERKICRQRGSSAIGLDVQPAPELPHPFLHPKDTHADVCAFRASDPQRSRGEPVSFIRNREDDLVGPALEADAGCLASGVEVDVRQSLLDNPVERQLDLAGQSAELGRHVYMDFYPTPLGKACRVPS
jgi:hypothetical protein